MSHGVDGEAGNGRGERGRFAPGNSYAKGNGGYKRVAELRNALQDAMTVEKMREAEAALFEQVKAGDTTAIRLWLEYAIGKPAQPVEVSGPDGRELGEPDLHRVLTAIAKALEPFPEAGWAVAAALEGIERVPDDGPGDRAGDRA
jgi:hypothetical protein